MDERRIKECYKTGFENQFFQNPDGLVKAVRDGEVGASGQKPTDEFFSRMVIAGAVILGRPEIEKEFSRSL